MARGIRCELSRSQLLRRDDMAYSATGRRRAELAQPSTLPDRQNESRCSAAASFSRARLYRDEARAPECAISRLALASACPDMRPAFALRILFWHLSFILSLLRPEPF